MAIGLGNCLRSITALGLAAQCAAASATLVSFTDGFGLTGVNLTFSASNDGKSPATITDITHSPASIPVNLLFNKFNPLLGNLTAVSISYTTNYAETAGLSATVLDSDDAPVSFFADGSLILALTGSLIPNQTQSPTVTSQCLNLISNTSCSNVQASAPGNFNGTIPESLAPFIGPGNFSLTATITSALNPRTTPDNKTGSVEDFPDNTSMSGTFTSNWGGSVSVNYTYDVPTTTSVPEPLPLYLLAGGLGGLALFRKRRRR